MNMDVGVVSERLGTLIKKYRTRFAGNPDDGFSLFATTLSEEDLIARLERAIVEGKPYDPEVEEMDTELRSQVEAGTVLLS
jgi:hypothetical protein